MASSSQIELALQLTQAGNSLLSGPSSVEDLLSMLDKVEQLLVNVEQQPFEAMKDALLPAMKALSADKLLRHSDVDVRLSVASCMSEITRITAPDVPYNDDLMKEIFQLTIAALEKLSNVSTRGYMKAVSILDTAAKTRTCMMMLDLECNAMIYEMFQQFLKNVRSNHPHGVFLAMEAVMSMVINESEDVPMDILTTLLASIRKENQNISPVSWKLGEKVITNCAGKLRPYLMEAVRSMGISVDDYAQVVASMFHDRHDSVQPDHVGGSGATKGLAPDAACHEVGRVVISSSKSGPSSDNAAIENDDSEGTKISKCSEPCHLAKDPKDADINGCTEPVELAPVRMVQYEVSPETIPKKRGRRPNYLMNPEEGYYYWSLTEKTARKPSNGRKPRLRSSVIAGASSASPEHCDPIRDHKRGRPRKHSSSHNPDPNFTIAENGRCLVPQTGEKESQSANVLVKKEPEGEINTDSTHSVMRVGANGSSVPTDNRKMRRREIVSFDRDISEASGSKKSTAVSAMKLKRKRVAIKEEPTEMRILDERLVGQKIKVWWPMDKVFYEGIISSFDHKRKRHKVLYADGDMETLNLIKQRWELIGSDDFPDGGQEIELVKPDALSNIPCVEKDIKSGSAEQEKA